MTRTVAPEWAGWGVPPGWGALPPDATGMTGGDADKQVSGMTRIGADRAAGRRPPWWAAVAAVALVVAVPVATWWLLGDQTTPRVKRLRQASPYPPDYALFRPFEIAPQPNGAAGVVAVALVVVAVVVLVGAWLTGRLHVGWWGVLGAAEPGGGGVGLDVASPDRRRRRT
jgi:hypothetical protein